MATIRVRDWTKERIEEVREKESHSSHDSVIKALLKDRELAKFAGTSLEGEEKETKGTPDEPTDKIFNNLTVLAELVHADNGVLFLWCPNCGNEIAHLGVENPISIPIFEMECQRCLSRLNQHAIVGIEIGYPIEERIIEETLDEDLKACVIDYWDRTIQRIATEPNPEENLDEEQLIRQFEEFRDEFGWDWPTDIPVIGLKQGKKYHNKRTDDRIEVIEQMAEDRSSANTYRVKKLSNSEGKEEAETELWKPTTVMDLILSRDLYVE
ncbi:hypothetical protein [Haladaptatus halobius]|uniref:hypothetical protein n=1 Tax=Haladaptatus halobius TaxID=2884875 RepID=UPI001D0B8EAA|nr:hypothetical protein [Haladaptatus halobius]